MKYIFTVLVFFAVGSSCTVASDSDNKKGVETGGTKTPSTNAGDAQLNINILWDLSDRIDPKLNAASPAHSERDIEAIKTITRFFKKDMERRGAYKAKGKIRVFFTPPPEDGKVNKIAEDLSCNLAGFNGDGANRKKKEWHDSIENRFSKNANEICQLILARNQTSKQWDGSDIWRFFKNDVKDNCIDPSGNYRNILVLLTDGYIYHKDSKIKQGNRTSYILPDVLKPFRNNPNWQTDFNNENYGLLTTRSDLQNLEVLVLEITPSKEYKNDEDLLKAYLGKWFEEMGVPKANYACYNTDLPEYTKGKIEAFLSR